MDELLIYIEKRRVISAYDALKILGNRMKLKRLVDEGRLSQVYPKGMGLYTLPSIDEGEAQFAALSHYYQNCVVSRFSALELYKLSNDYAPEKIDVDIPNTTNLFNELLDVHRVNPKKIFDIEERVFDGVPFKIKIYSPERCLYEAYKYGSFEHFIRAIKRYRENYLDKSNPGIQYDKVKSIDKKLKSKILETLIMDDVYV